MKLSAKGLLIGQPFDTSEDLPKPEWMTSWWYGGLLLVSALSAFFGAICMVVSTPAHAFAGFATSATMFSIAGIAEWSAGLKARALNSGVVVILAAVAVFCALNVEW